ncbi:MAG: nucleoside triphosphate pyrophosphohydrolase [Candidatus Omnitrophica bacterium]|nr:nucleoside triphosphate pyrophosphohydrolase [Candidatus Omnitrophota bacterium]
MNQLIDIMKTLRGPNGCPWDRKQTFETLMSCLLEEVHEMIDSVLEKDSDKIREELGDTVCIIAMLISIGEEKKLFTKKTVMQGAIKKMVHRHPHVFGSERARTSGTAHALWHTAKNKEKGVSKRISILDDLSSSFPALHRSDKIGRRVARVGFDWPDMKGVFNKVDEELAEIKKEVWRRRRNNAKIQEELGDLLFSVVTIGRKLHLNSEIALRKTNNKFIKRFQLVERQLKKEGKKIGEVPLKELDAIWEEVKKRGKR